MPMHALLPSNMSPTQRGRFLTDAYLENAFAEYCSGNAGLAERLVDKAAPSASYETMGRYFLAIAIENARRGRYDVATEVARRNSVLRAELLSMLLDAYYESLGLSGYATSLTSFLVRRESNENALTRRAFWEMVAKATQNAFGDHPENILPHIMGLARPATRRQRLRSTVDA